MDSNDVSLPAEQDCDINMVNKEEIVNVNGSNSQEMEATVLGQTVTNTSSLSTSLESKDLPHVEPNSCSIDMNSSKVGNVAASPDTNQHCLGTDQTVTGTVTLAQCSNILSDPISTAKISSETSITDSQTIKVTSSELTEKKIQLEASAVNSLPSEQAQVLAGRNDDMDSDRDQLGEKIDTRSEDTKSCQETYNSCSIPVNTAHQTVTTELTETKPGSILDKSLEPDSGKMNTCSSLMPTEGSVQENCKTLTPTGQHVSESVHSGGEEIVKMDSSTEVIPGGSEEIMMSDGSTKNIPEGSEEVMKSDSSTKNIAEESEEVSPPSVTSAVQQIFTAYRGLSDEEHHIETDSSSESSSDSESDMKVEDSSGESEDERKKKADDNKAKDPISSVKTKGELGLTDLPPIESLSITIDERTPLMEIGKVSSVIGPLVIIQSNPGSPALDLETVLFIEGRKSMGQVFETFGPVVNPYYSVRYNSSEEIEEKGLVVGTPVFFAPKTTQYTQYVFLTQLRQMKGSDASWENNNEPPEKFIDYSDDEQERAAKNNKKRGKDKNAENPSEEETNMCQLPGAVAPMGRRHNQRQRGSHADGRGRGRGQSIPRSSPSNPFRWPSESAPPHCEIRLNHRPPRPASFSRQGDFRSQQPHI